MQQLGVYLTFPGKCEEALHFYKNCFDGEILSLQRFGEMPQEQGSPEMPEDFKQKVMHSEFKAGDLYFMASDDMYHKSELVMGSNLTLSLNFGSEKEQEKVFNRLAEGGKITMPLEDTFWGARFGMLTDKYGFHWMVNCDKK